MKPTQCVIKLCKPIENINKNITADNYFSSIETPDELRKRGLTYVGTMRKNKLAIPKGFHANNNRRVGLAMGSMEEQHWFHLFRKNIKLSY